MTHPAAQAQILAVIASAADLARDLLDVLQRESQALATMKHVGLNVAADPLFTGIDLIQAMDVPGLAGRAAAQVEEFIGGPVRAALAECPTRAAESALRV